MSIADKFTLSRLLLAPVFFILYFLPVWLDVDPVLITVIIVPLVAFMEFTDYLDGHYARKYNEVSDFGKLFDPFADVVAHLTILFCLVISDYFPSWIFILIFYREFCMLFIRLIAIQKGVAIAARKGGKLKTVLYIVTGFYYLAIELSKRCGISFGNSLEGLIVGGYVLSAICLLASYVSFVDYLIHFKKMFKK